MENWSVSHSVNQSIYQSHRFTTTRSDPKYIYRLLYLKIFYNVLNPYFWSKYFPFFLQMKLPTVSVATVTWWWTGLIKQKANPIFLLKVMTLWHHLSCGTLIQLQMFNKSVTELFPLTPPAFEKWKYDITVGQAPFLIGMNLKWVYCVDAGERLLWASGSCCVLCVRLVSIGV